MFKSFSNTAKIALVAFFSSLYFYLPILTIYYQRKGLNLLQINSLLGIIIGTIFLAEIPTGLIADKVGRKISIILAMAFQLLGEILFLSAQNYTQFVLVATIAGIGFAFQSGCLQALVYDSLKQQNKEGEMKKIMGNIESFRQAGYILGAFISSFIISELTTSKLMFTIILTIASVAIALLISLFLHEPDSKYHHSEKSPLKIIFESLQLIKNNTSLKRIILLGIITTPFIAYLGNLHPPYFEMARIPSTWLGLSRGIAGIIAILATRYAYKLEAIFGVEKGMIIATSIPAILYLLMSFTFNPLVATLLFILNFGLMPVQEPILADYYNRHISHDIRATTLSTINMFSSFYIAVMGLIIGKIADIYLPGAFLFMGLVVLVGSLFLRINESHLKN